MNQGGRSDDSVLDPHYDPETPDEVQRSDDEHLLAERPPHHEDR